MRGPSGQFRKPGQNEEVEVLLAGLMENVQLLAGSTPAPRTRPKGEIHPPGDEKARMVMDA